MIPLMIVDQSPTVRSDGARILGDLGFAVIEAASPLEAIARCETALPRVLIIDSGLPGALELIAAIRRLPEGTRCRIFYCIAQTDLRGLMEGKHAGADCYLLKPFDTKILKNVFVHLALAA